MCVAVCAPFVGHAEPFHLYEYGAQPGGSGLFRLPPRMNAPITLGPAIISGGTGYADKLGSTGNNDATRGGLSGMKVTVAVPVAEVPGLDLLLSASSGRNETTDGTGMSAATVTLGARLAF